MKITISEAEAERIADRTVQRRCEQSAAYRHAENADEQAQAEDVIEQNVWKELEAKYNIV